MRPYTAPLPRVSTFSPDKIAEIRERSDIVALVGQYVPLKRSGASMKGLCPFHPEKSSSFYVHPARQFFHCFGCQASGDAITFYMKIESVPFPEAVRVLADRAGIELPVMDARAEEESRRARGVEERLYAVLDAAAGYYCEQLKVHPFGGFARDELTRRAVNDSTAETFRLGYAPHAWDGLTQALRSRGYDLADAAELGLCMKRRSGDGYYDRFRHRLMFPVSDVHGRVVAFSGRVLEPPPGEKSVLEEAPGKYVNSPESVLYKKGETVFGLFEGRVEVRREAFAILCEGNFDVLALHQHGFRNAVAPLGTAFTIAQARLLRRYAERILLLFDGDAAGRKATRAAYATVMEVALSASVVRLPQGDDPDSFLRARGAEGLRSLVAAASGLVEFLIDDAATGAAGDARTRALAIESLGPVLAKVENPVETRLYIERIAQRFGVSDVNAVREQLRRGVRAERAAERPMRQGAGQSQGQDPEQSGQRMSEASRARPVVDEPLPMLEAEILGALLDHPKLFDSEDGISAGDLLTNAQVQSIFHAAREMVQRGSGIDGAALVAAVPEGAARGWVANRLAVEKFDERGAQAVLRDSLPRLRKDRIMSQLPQLKEQLLAAQRSGQTELAQEFARKHDDFLGQLRALQGGKR